MKPQQKELEQSTQVDDLVTSGDSQLKLHRSGSNLQSMPNSVDFVITSKPRWIPTCFSVQETCEGIREAYLSGTASGYWTLLEMRLAVERIGMFLFTWRYTWIFRMYMYIYILSWFKIAVALGLYSWYARRVRYDGTLVWYGYACRVRYKGTMIQLEKDYVEPYGLGPYCPWYKSCGMLHAMLRQEIYDSGMVVIGSCLCTGMYVLSIV